MNEPCSLETGLRAFERGQYEQAASLLLPFAQQGIVRAQLLLSRLYYAGNGVAQDMERYRYWLERAAQGGDRTARAKLKRLKMRQG